MEQEVEWCGEGKIRGRKNYKKGVQSTGERCQA